MCTYRYVYYSACQHPELYRVRYCETAQALEQPQRDDHYRPGAGADTSGHPAGLAAPGQATSPSNSHSQKQHHSKMSTLPSVQAGPAPSPHDSMTPVARVPHADRIPRSVLGDYRTTSQVGTPLHCDSPRRAPAVLDTQGYSNLNIAIPLDTQSSLSMELTHDGKVMELVARFEPYNDRTDSDASQAHDGDRTRASSAATVRPYDHNDGPISEQKTQLPVTAIRTEHSQSSHVPSMLGKGGPRAPNLRTAMRFEERRKKTMDEHLSTQRKSLRTARSLNFLTKDARETVKPETTTSSGPYSPVKLQHSSSQTSLASPATSPMRSSPRQQSSIRIRVSPTKSSRLSMASLSQVRAPSSNASTRETVYRSASQSPVSLNTYLGFSRDIEGSPCSFVTASEAYEDEDIPLLSLTCANGSEQTLASSEGTVPPQPTHRRGESEPQVKLPAVCTKPTIARPAAPKLSLRIPHHNPSPTDRKSPLALSSTSSSPLHSSRIPRISATVQTEEPRNRRAMPSTATSPLQRTNPIKSLVSRKERPEQSISKASTIKNIAIARSAKNQTTESSTVDPYDIPLPETPHVPPRHVRTINSSGATPIVGCFSSAQATSTSPLESSESDCRTASPITTVSIATDDVPDRLAFVTSYLEHMDANAVLKHKCSAMEESHKQEETYRSTSFSETISKMLSRSTSRAASASTVKKSKKSSVSAHSGTEDPALADSAIIYSRKKSDASATLVDDASPTRGRPEEHAPPVRREARSQHSIQSSLSDLRATAPEFVPLQPAGYVPSRPSLPGEWQQHFGSDLLPFEPFGIDAYGMPWTYHMYPAPLSTSRHFARSPKKGRNYRSRKRGDSSPKKEKPAASPPVLENGSPSKASTGTAFASQLEEIARHAADRHGKPYRTSPPSFNSHTVPSGPRGGRPVRNVGNGLYNSFGHSRGIPIEATTPFPDPVPPSAVPKEYVGYSIVADEKGKEQCRVLSVERGMEWGGGTCNGCAPDH